MNLNKTTQGTSKNTAEIELKTLIYNQSLKSSATIDVDFKDEIGTNRSYLEIKKSSYKGSVTVECRIVR